MAHARAFETELVDAGTLLLKFWIHLPRKEMGERLGEKGKKGRKRGKPDWQVEQGDWRVYEHYDHAMREAQNARAGTVMLVNLSGRGDKDVQSVVEALR